MVRYDEKESFVDILREEKVSESQKQTINSRVGIVRDPFYLQHATGADHPEKPQRLEAIYRALDRDGLGAQCQLVEPRMISLEELERLHTPRYIEQILDTAHERLRYLDPDTVTSALTCEAAFLAAGGALKVVEKVVAGRLDRAFALIRPPGHHAMRTHAMGFCIFNNLALAAVHALQRPEINRVLIVDWDVHHGNGTQDAFWEDPRILFFSLHNEPPFFPGTGAVDDVGEKEGRGYTVNVPLPACTGDKEYIGIFQRILEPIAMEFCPDLVLVPAGFDPHRDDPIGKMQVTEYGFNRMTDIVLGIAQACCQGRIVFALEGGYDSVSLTSSVCAIIRRLLDPPCYKPGSLPLPDWSNYPERTRMILDEVVRVQRAFWKNIE